MAVMRETGSSRLPRATKTSSAGSESPVRNDRRAIKSTSSVRSTTGKPPSTLNKPPIVEQPSPASKFILAMKDPNWRQRKSMSDASESMIRDTSTHRHFLERSSASSSKTPKSVSGRSSEDSESHEVWTLSSSPTPDEPGKTGTERHDITGRLHAIWPSETIMESRNSENFEALIDEKKNVFSVIGHVQLENRTTNGNSLSLIEVVPYDPDRHDPESRMVHIWRQSTPTTDGAFAGPKSEIGKQHSSPLQDTTCTPKTTKASTGLQISPLAKQRVKSEMAKAREAVLRDSAVADVRRVRRERNNLDRLPSSYSFREQDKPAQTPSVSSQNEGAFQKMLQKLHKNSNSKTKEESKRFLQGSQVSTAGQQGSVSDTRKRSTQESNSRDSGYESANAQNSSSAGNVGTKPNTFNPKAREFMSLVDASPKENVKARPKFKRPAIEDLFGKTLADLDTSKNVATDGAQKQGTGDTVLEDTAAATGSSYLPPPPPPPLPSWQNISPINTAPAYPSISSGFSMPPSSPFATWAPGQCPVVALPIGGMAPGGSWIGGIPLLPLPPMASSFVPSVPHAGLFGMNPLANYMPAPTATVPGPNYAASPQNPGPVSKPRVPDAVKQQQYEAWIEWRKANEPGYAMECKMRQQRRSQRNNTSKQKSESAGNQTTGLAAAEAMDVA